MSKPLTSEQCGKALSGWACTRRAGHSGPCAAVPMSNRDGLPPITEADFQAVQGVIDQLFENKRRKNYGTEEHPCPVPPPSSADYVTSNQRNGPLRVHGKLELPGGGTDTGLWVRWGDYRFLETEIERLTRELEARSPIIDSAYMAMLKQENDRLREALVEIEALLERPSWYDEAMVDSLLDIIGHIIERVLPTGGAGPVEEIDTSRVAQIRKAPYPESARSQGGGRAHSQGEVGGSTPASGLPVETAAAHRFGSQAAIGECELSGGHTWPVNPPPADGVMCMKCGAVSQR